MIVGKSQHLFQRSPYNRFEITNIHSALAWVRWECVKGASGFKLVINTNSTHLVAEVLRHFGRAHCVEHRHKPQPTAEAPRNIPIEGETA
jgi:hypothetical protein